MTKAGEYTNKVIDYKNIIKQNNIITEDGELVRLHDQVYENLAMDFITYQEQQEEARREQKEKAKFFRDKTEFEQAIKSNLGSFYFNFYNSLPKIERQYLFRFIYLSTYLKYDDDRIMIKDGQRYKLIKENELQKLLGLKKTEYFNTKKVLIDNKLIRVDPDGYIHINSKISTLGNISRTKKEYTRIFKDSIRELYEKSTPREHKKLYIFYELLPYINYNLNIVCFNPEEVNPELIEPITINDIIDNFYINKQRSVAKKQLLTMTLGGEYLFIMITKYNKDFFVVNPKLYYKGNKIEDLNYLIDLFRV